MTRENTPAGGFTLVELLVVVLIIGILAAVALPQYNLAVAKSRFAEVVLLTQDMKRQQEVFFMENSRYASDCVELNPDLPAGTFIKSGDNDHLFFTGDEEKSISCSNGGGTRVGITAPNANLELWLDHAERTPAQEKGFCRAKTDLGHKLCAQMGKTKEGGKTYNYYF